ncbi:MAG: triose-phosphate isomerase [Brevundimonas subvibrioides]|uniref:Triosephosphate isomerase n=1 Tax=Brevundimonas subvibrioides TaxID=74313 RepID=A0A258HK40_9CAUL|nr:triose-phosphate isomerase [Brevundimonas subvibrioides]OYX56954.1 MAG: triose-phosphate isomerase [Brevundimonas subvibrioides]
MKQSVKMIVGNWKMNGLAADLSAAVVEMLADLKGRPASARVGLCPPATLIERMVRTIDGGPVSVGGQDCRVEAKGAFTGGVSAEMLVDAGARLVILGHSERRQEFGESDALVSDKVGAALRAGLTPIVCVGETLAQREAGEAASVVRGQILGSLNDGLAGQDWALAYEPVWAIGTGLTPTLEQIAEIHAAARAAMVERLGDGGRAALILYGGSVNPGNARDILAVDEVGGALVGGASLKAADFLAIIRAAEPAVVAADGQG